MRAALATAQGGTCPHFAVPPAPGPAPFSLVVTAGVTTRSGARALGAWLRRQVLEEEPRGTACLVSLTTEPPTPTPQWPQRPARKQQARGHRNKELRPAGSEPHHPMHPTAR